ncbi:MAG: DivIVA domain-containing protein [Clostridia bacterium]|nr:DivIVA domain-containing protein [Clostridia bacterium]
MLTPEKIQSKEFEQSVLGGYRRDEVDAFLDEVEADYRKLFEENKDMVEKLKVCLAKIEEYKKDETFLKNAIINAQKLNETTLKEIEEKEKEVEMASKEAAANIVAEAEAKAAAIIEKAEKDSADAVNAAREQCKAEIDAEQKKCDKEIRAIQKEVTAEQKKLDYLRKQVSEFKTTILDIYRAHVTSISKLPDFNEPEEEEVAVAEPAAEEKVEYTPAAPIEVAEPEKQEIVENAAEADDTTVEFKLNEKKEEKAEPFVKPSKFENLKFGVDYNINDDK